MFLTMFTITLTSLSSPSLTPCFSNKRSTRSKSGPTALVQSQLAPTTLVQTKKRTYQFEQEIHEHS